MIKWLLFLLLLMFVLHLLICGFEPSLHPWEGADLVMVNDLSNMLLDSVCHYFTEDFCIDIH
jgi:hypothetical protein